MIDLNSKKYLQHSGCKLLQLLQQLSNNGHTCELQKIQVVSVRIRVRKIIYTKEVKLEKTSMWTHT